MSKIIETVCLVKISFDESKDNLIKIINDAPNIIRIINNIMEIGSKVEDCWINKNMSLWDIEDYTKFLYFFILEYQRPCFGRENNTKNILSDGEKLFCEKIIVFNEIHKRNEHLQKFISEFKETIPIITEFNNKDFQKLLNECEYGKILLIINNALINEIKEQFPKNKEKYKIILSTDNLKEIKNNLFKDTPLIVLYILKYKIMDDFIRINKPH